MIVDKPQWVVDLEKEPCRCERCKICGGTGYELGPFSVDDVQRAFEISASEPCEYCFNGISEVCDRCQALEEFEFE